MPNNTNNPLVTVVMPVYNAERFLRESLDSILRQTYTRFELIVINDGSTDSSKKIIDEYSKKDSRIISIHQNNQGVVATANHAIQLAKGKYIARMDADDVSMPNRLSQQVDLFKKNPDAILVCSDFEVFDEDGNFCYREILPTKNDDIKRSLYIRNPIANGSTMIQKDALISADCFDNVFAEDFHLWIKLSKIGNFLSTGSVLYRWRMNPNGLTLSNNDLSIKHGKEYMESLWKDSRPDYTPRKEIIHTSKYYLDESRQYGVARKEIYLNDLSQTAAKLFIHKYYKDGFKQLIAVASTGRTGLKIALRRLHLISQGHYNKLRKIVPFGRMSYID